jgi:ribA/ribD-fused uncharacterized protein
VSQTPDQSQIRTYQVSECVVFKRTNERFGGLSNMAPGFPLEINGIRIRTSEALYQACRFPLYPDIQRLIIQQGSPMTAKMKGKPHTKRTRSDWDRVRVNIMRWCLRVKLAQNWQKFGALLLATGDQPIVEESRKDDFWGAKPANYETLVGANVLGRLLMELREELRRKNEQFLMRVEPPTVQNFLLYGRAIGVVQSDERVSAEGVSISAGSEQSAPVFSKPIDIYASDQESKEGTVEQRAGNGKSAAIPKECKRLAEVDFPIAVVSKHAVSEKYVRQGHPSTLHLWWARRPLAACRAMLLGLLLPDPCDEHCPEDFKEKTRELLPKVQGEVGTEDADLRKSLLKFIGDFANWDFSSDRTYLEVSRGLVKAAHPEETLLVVDPFAGGGSIPLEALRLGCETFASDLNPVACLILKVMLEDIQGHRPQLVEELRRVAAEIKRELKKDLANFYPKDPDGATPAVYLWARTVRCESPSCGAEIPLVRSFWLSKKASRKRALQHRVVRRMGQPPHVEFALFEPKNERDVPPGTVSQAKATCLACSNVLAPDRVRAQISAQQGGADVCIGAHGERTEGALLIAVVTLRDAEQGRHYRLATKQDYAAVARAMQRLTELTAGVSADRISAVPNEPTPRDGTGSVGGGFRTWKYGVHSFGNFFSSRQKLALVTLAKKISHMEMSEPCRHLLGCALGIFARSCNGNARLRPDSSVAPAFGMQTLPITWTFPETVPWGSRSEHFDGAVEGVLEVVSNRQVEVGHSGQVQIADAAESRLPDETASIWFTDPPYYDSVPYADLSDFFFVWLKRALPAETVLRDPFDPTNPLTPKFREAVRDMQDHLDGRPKKPTEWYEQQIYRCFKEGRRVLREDGMGSVVFAHKTTEGWEALLSGMIRAGWTITGSWPIATEMATRLRARESAALATSVHLVCRPRADDAAIGDWGEVHRELPQRVADWMERLQSEHIRGADLVFACIGPALEIYSRYSKVVDAEDREIPLGGDPEATEPHKRGYLAYVWEAVGRAALEQVLGTADATARNGAAGALEEDARLTALFLWTLQSTNGETSPSPSPSPVKGEGMNREEESEDDEGDDEETSTKAKKKKGLTLVFDVVRRFAQPLGIHLDTWEDRIIETEKGIVRLLPVGERGTQLFGQDGADLVAERLEREPTGAIQMALFPERTDAPQVKSKKGKGKKGTAKDLRTNTEATTLDRVHAAMLLQASGRTNALRALLQTEQDRGPEFLRLANALSALYPRESEEKRLLDAMLLAVPR